MPGELEKKKEVIELNIQELDPGQVRLLRSLIFSLEYVLKTQNEAAFFDESAKCIRSCASLIKQANFVKDLSRMGEIPYGDQALEYSVDILKEYMGSSKLVQYDN